MVHHGGRRKKRRVGDKETAARVAQGVRERLARGDFSLPPSSAASPTLRAYAEAWVTQAMTRLKASTVAFYEATLARHVWPALGTRLVSSIRRSDCRDLVTACRAGGLKVNTVRGIARTLSTVLSQAVEDEWLPANPALRLGKYLRCADDPEPVIDPFTRDEVAHVLSVARGQFPDWYPWLLCGLRTGMRAGELLALQWSDFNWRLGYVLVQRNLVRGQVTTPKSHRRRRVDVSRQLAVTLRLWRRQQRALWLKKGFPFPPWVFASVAGTALDESNVRKALNRILDAAGLNRRGPHQMRHTFASLLLQVGVPITYVAAQLGHRDPSITLRVYSHWLPDASRARLVDRLDETTADGPQTAPRAFGEHDQKSLSAFRSVVSRIFASWNQVAGWLRRVGELQRAG